MARETRTMNQKAQSFEGTTLALQHYYDIVGVSRRLPLITVYRADEQPFGHQMAVWMTEYRAIVPESTAKRLDQALLLNRQIESPAILRCLDYGTTEGQNFLVTDAFSAITLKAWLTANGPAAPWQALRLLDQLAGVVTTAHRAGFRKLCLDANQIFLTDTDRFTIALGPLGIGLTRREIQSLEGVMVTPDLARHIPPWAYADVIQSDESEASESTDSMPAQGAETATKPDQSSATLSHLASDSAADCDGIQDIGACADVESDAPEGMCEDVYDVAAIIYEALCAAHPYFGEDSDLATVALDLSQASPIEIGRRVDIAPAISDTVMRYLNAPRQDSVAEFLADFAAACDAESRENARIAEKAWLAPRQLKAPEKRQKKLKLKSKWSAHIFFAIIAASFAIAIFATYHIARVYRPIDLFAIPEIVPQVQDGVDILFTSAGQGKTTLYLTSLADGSLLKLGDLPYVYRNQPKGAKLDFVVTADNGKSTQIPVVVKSDADFMVVQVPVN